MIRPLARLMAVLLLVGAAGWLAEAAAQPGPGRHGPGAGGPGQHRSIGAPPRAAPHRAAPASRMAPRMAPRGPMISRPGPGLRHAAPPSRVPRAAGPRHIGPRVGSQVGPRQLPPRLVSPPQRSGPRVGQPLRGPRVISPAGAGRRLPPGSSIAAIRGERRLSMGGRNYSVWRDRHRVHRHGHWRTFVGLGSLGALAIAGATYYPYAYIDAPAPRCEGWTEDGCELHWRRVETLEGETDYACVAYCPWE